MAILKMDGHKGFLRAKKLQDVLFNGAVSRITVVNSTCSHLILSFLEASSNKAVACVIVADFNRVLKLPMTMLQLKRL